MSTGPAAPWSAEAFERKYRLDPDPFRFATSAYEQGRYDATMRVLQRRNYGIAFEPGCSIGELTTKLAPCCDRVIAMDVSATALRTAAARCSHIDNVSWVHGSLAENIPDEALDLVVLSEVGYYFDVAALERIVAALGEHFAERVEVVAVHWLGRSADHVLHGDEVHEVLRTRLDHLDHAVAQRHDGFRIDTWTR